MGVVVPEKRRVNWWQVIGGLVTAWVTGALVGTLAAAGSTAFFHGDSQMGWAFLSVTVAVALFYFIFYWLLKRGARDFAVGLIIGGCMTALVAGICGAMFSGLTSMH